MNLTIQTSKLDSCSGCRKPHFNGALQKGQKIVLKNAAEIPNTVVRHFEEKNYGIIGTEIKNAEGKILQNKYYLDENRKKLWVVEDFVDGVKDKIMTLFTSGENKGQIQTVRNLNGEVGPLMDVKNGTVSGKTYLG